MVDLSAVLRDEVRGILEEIRSHLLTGALPEPVNDERCEECQLLHHCLPRLSSAPRRVRRYIDDIVFECAT